MVERGFQGSENVFLTKKTQNKVSFNPREASGSYESYGRLFCNHAKLKINRFRPTINRFFIINFPLLCGSLWRLKSCLVSSQRYSNWFRKVVWITILIISLHCTLLVGGLSELLERGIHSRCPPRAPLKARASIQHKCFWTDERQTKCQAERYVLLSRLKCHSTISPQGGDRIVKRCSFPGLRWFRLV